MANGAEIIRNELWRTFDSLYEGIRVSILRAFARNKDEKALLISVDDETHALLSNVAEQNTQPVEVVVADWLASQGKAYQKAKTLKAQWERLSEREKQVVALCCLDYEEEEIAKALHIAFGTARTHLYNAIRKFGLQKKGQLLYFLQDWDFSDFDRDYFE